MAGYVRRFAFLGERRLRGQNAAGRGSHTIRLLHKVVFVLFLRKFGLLVDISLLRFAAVSETLSGLLMPSG